MFYFVHLPVFGQMGPKTEFYPDAASQVVVKFHCLLDSMPRSDFWKISPCFIASEELAKKLEQNGYSGFEIRTALFKPGDAFHHFHGKNAQLPKLKWCHITGQAYQDDLGLAEGRKLIVSERVKQLLESGQHEGVSFVAGDKPPSDEEITEWVWAEAAKVAAELRAKRKA
jgi:hypothetical protein